ncbi:protein 5NUC-like [Venturia canescens]|uniref:protein 5NUC-like n=1 Tax=Venturia canescens TaxID=32260 RepID=UPI001C9D4FF9|nr:protein 5NUC-like [Venturia canescens]XP_043280618.1 protein 5NUC-like [Venturia canescens]XP_043280619.1 protein 5NUC-like [Venturia canescens]XP_043280620.1 protein 5NUC-like [Venturia canescens]
MRPSTGTLFSIVLTFYLTNGASGHPLAGKETDYVLNIVHTNDMHSRFDETSALSTKCLMRDAAARKCYGGFARIATLVRQARKSTTPTLFLNAGDTYQGSIWFNVHKWRIVSKFLNILSPDAISLGNHEFDDGPMGLVPFIQNATFPIVTANLDLRKEPELAASKLKNSTILEVRGKRIGIIGYLTPDTKVIAATGKVEFFDEVESIKREVAKLRAAGVNILIAVGHSGFETDKKIAAEVDGIDLVIGGHTNTFLYTGKQPDVEVPEGLYPTEIVQKNNRKVYVVQAYAYTKYLGNITVGFDKNGEVTSILGNPILVDSNIEEAEDVLEELEKWRPAVNDMINTVVGSTKVFLDGDGKSCRRKECNLGNLITDAMIDYNAKQYVEYDGWTDAAIAIHNSGSIRTSIRKAEDEKITMSDLLSVLPFNNGLQKLSLTGQTFRKVLEWSVHSLKVNDTADLNGGYLQFSGVQVIYDLSKPAGSRVSSVEVRCALCSVPSFSKLVDNATYTILLTDFLRGGGDGFNMFMNLTYTTAGITTDELLVDYLKTKSPVHPDVEWRIGYLIRSGDDEMISTEPDATDLSYSDMKTGSGSWFNRAATSSLILPLLAYQFI